MPRSDRNRPKTIDAFRQFAEMEDAGAYLPDAETIARKCEQIREAWNRSREKTALGEHHTDEPFTIPLVSTSLKIGQHRRGYEA